MSKTLRKISNPLLKMIVSLPLFKYIHPNVITYLGIVPPTLFFIFTVNEMYIWAFVCSSLFVLDTLDGAVARYYGKESKFGAFLDSSIDRLSDGLIISSFGFAKIVPWWLIIAVLVTSFLISYVRAKAEIMITKDVNFSVGIAQRAQRLILILLALLALEFFPEVSYSEYNIATMIFGVLFLLGVITVIQRFYFVIKNLD
jgi:archaetidylinositol phosphate synthase